MTRVALPLFPHTISTFTLWLLLIFPASHSQASAEEPADADALLAAYSEFASTSPYSDRPSGPPFAQLASHCSWLNRECLEYIQTNRAVLQNAVPDNPEYWSRYSWLIEKGMVPIELNDSMTIPDYRNMIEATRAWLFRETLQDGVTDASRLHQQLSAHRRRSAMATNLLERMIFVATTGVLIPAINLHMAHRQQPPTPRDRKLLDSLLQPLTVEETSMRRTLEGEMRHVFAAMKRDAVDHPHTMREELVQVHAYVAERSEADTSDFWRNGVDVMTSVVITSDPEAASPRWGYYATTIRYTNISLTVLRALREIYEGRSSPGVPGQPAPDGWAWNWKIQTQELCLHPVDIHPSLAEDHTLELCHTWFEKPVLTSMAQTPESSSLSPAANQR